MVKWSIIVHIPSYPSINKNPLEMKETTGVFNMRSSKQTKYLCFVFHLYFTLVKIIIVIEITILFTMFNVT